MCKTASLIGLAMKAGKISSGEYQTEDSVKKGKAFFVIIASDASTNTRKKFQNMCDFYEVECISKYTKEELGQMIGREYRACLAINDSGFAQSIKQQLQLMAQESMEEL